MSLYQNFLKEFNKTVQSSKRDISEIELIAVSKKKSAAKIEVDGGINAVNAKNLISLGVDVLVAGSFIFKSEEPLLTIADLKQITI